MTFADSKPLAGLRVLTVESFGAAPYGTMYLAALGAEVIKVEQPAGGDAARSVGPRFLGDDDSEYFQTFNLNKKSITLDLKTAAGRSEFLRLCGSSAAVVNNLRGDLPVQLGLDYASLENANPALVCVHISAYGREGERASWPGYDFLMQAETGLMSLTGEPGTPPTRIPVSTIDYMTGLAAMVGALACIMRARETGRGCDVDVNLFEIAAHQLGYVATWFLNGSELPSRQSRAAHASVTPVQVVRTSDGWVYVMCMKEKFWAAYAQAIKRDDLLTDSRFSTAEARTVNRDALTRELDLAMQTETTERWLQILGGTIPIAPILDMSKAFQSRQMIKSEIVQEVIHPASRGGLKVLGCPLRIDGRRPEASAAHGLGTDNSTLS